MSLSVQSAPSFRQYRLGKEKALIARVVKTLIQWLFTCEVLETARSVALTGMEKEVK